jgi:hypothetical protein
MMSHVESVRFIIKTSYERNSTLQLFAKGEGGGGNECVVFLLEIPALIDKCLKGIFHRLLCCRDTSKSEIALRFSWCYSVQC